jgi:hypothetical protein
MLRQQRSRINALPVAVKALPEEEMHSVRNGLDNLKVGLKFLFTQSRSKQFGCGRNFVKRRSR